jgi:hypothetical protein
MQKSMEPAEEMHTQWRHHLASSTRRELYALLMTKTCGRWLPFEQLVACSGPVGHGDLSLWQKVPQIWTVTSTWNLYSQTKTAVELQARHYGPSSSMKPQWANDTS